MPMNVVTRTIAAINWRLVLAALCGVGILHILATLAAPTLAVSTAFDRLKDLLPVNRIVALPAVAPGQQPLPFMSPALRYALCRFDTRNGPVEVSADMADAGTSLTVYLPGGEAIYATTSLAESTDQRIRLIPPDGRFLGLTPEARGIVARKVPSASIPAAAGLVVMAYPERGIAYQARTMQMLLTASCKAMTPDAVAQR